MEGTDIFLQELAVNHGVCPQPIRKMERKLFKAVAKGDLDEVKSALKCDVNCVNSSGKTVLQVAVNFKDATVRNDMINSLLDGGADLELALLYAVRESDVKSVDILLQFFDPSSLMPTSLKFTSIKRQGYITPLILAACFQNFQIVKLLLEHGFTISDLQTDPRRSVGSKIEGSEKLGPAVFRLYRYRALASPVFMAASFLQNPLSGPDPVHRACVLNKELSDIAEQEYEFRKEYLELSDGCKEFAVTLLNECRSMKEIKCVMEMPQNKGSTLLNTEGEFLNSLEFAIVTRNEKFVSHPYSQLVLNSEIYRHVPFLEKSSWKTYTLVLLLSILSPLFFMIWLVFDNFLPRHKVARMFHSPCLKFLIHCGSYQTFLLMLTLTSFQHQTGFLEYSIIDWMVLLFVIGQLVDVVKDVYQQGRVRFFSNKWNYLAVATVTSFVLYYVIWWSARATLKDKLDSLQWENHAQDRSYTVLLFSECLLAVAVLLAFAHNFSFIEANAFTGPLLQAFIQMLFDMMKFFFFFIFAFLAFVVSFTKLYLQYEKVRHHFLSSPAETNKKYSVHLDRFRSSVITMFWSLFGQIDHENFKLDERGYEAIWTTGMFLFGVFNIVAVLVAVNMLIAMLNESYTRITANLDAEWKLTRTKLWLSWVYKKGVLAPPFNLLYLILPFLWVLKRLLKACCPRKLLLFLERFVVKKPKPTWKIRRINETERREVIRHLIVRNLAKKACHLESEIESSDSGEDWGNESTVLFSNNGIDNCQFKERVFAETTKL